MLYHVHGYNTYYVNYMRCLIYPCKKYFVHLVRAVSVQILLIVFRVEIFHHCKFACVCVLCYLQMLALEASMERERCALHDRQVRLHSVHTDLGLDLPTSIHLPDGEEIPYGSSTRLHIRDAEQVSRRPFIFMDIGR